MKKDKEESRSTAAELRWRVALRRFAKTAPREVSDEWANHLELISFEENTAVATDSKDGGEEFQKQYGKELENSFSWACGKEICLTFQTKQKKPEAVPVKKENKTEKKVGKRAAGIVACLLAVFLFVSGMLFMNNYTYEKNFYPIVSTKADIPLRIVLLSELYDSEFGAGNRKLTEELERLKPDLILVTGNLSGKGASSAGDLLELCRKMRETAPVYYVYGNQEIALNQKVQGELRAMLESTGVTILQDEWTSVTVREEKIDIYGCVPSVSRADIYTAPEEYEEFLEGDSQNFKITLMSDPGMLEKTEGVSSWGDLVLTGGRLGGVIRVPVAGALYSQEYGFFPEKRQGAYMAGQYEIGNTDLIVSRGLKNTGFRLNNRPELAVIDIGQY